MFGHSKDTRSEGEKLAGTVNAVLRFIKWIVFCIIVFYVITWGVVAIDLAGDAGRRHCTPFEFGENHC